MLDVLRDHGWQLNRILLGTGSCLMFSQQILMSCRNHKVWVIIRRRAAQVEISVWEQSRSPSRLQGFWDAFTIHHNSGGHPFAIPRQLSRQALLVCFLHESAALANSAHICHIELTQVTRVPFWPFGPLSIRNFGLLWEVHSDKNGAFAFPEVCTSQWEDMKKWPCEVFQSKKQQPKVSQNNGSNFFWLATVCCLAVFSCWNSTFVEKFCCLLPDGVSNGNWLFPALEAPLMAIQALGVDVIHEFLRQWRSRSSPTGSEILCDVLLTVSAMKSFLEYKNEYCI